MASRALVSKGWKRGKDRDEVVRRMVRARSEFWAHLRAESDSRRWAVARMDRMLWCKPRSWNDVVDGES